MSDIQKIKKLFDELKIEYAEENDGIITTLHVSTDAGMDNTDLCYIFSYPDGAYRNSEIWEIEEDAEEE
jgi:hypothetical protein